MTTNSPNPVDGDVHARKQKRIDHSKLATEIVHNLVSTDSCDEEVTEKLILWVLNRLNKEFPTQPAQLLRPVDLSRLDRLLPTNHRSGEAFMAADSQGNYVNLESLVKSLRQQGYEVKND